MADPPLTLGELIAFAREHGLSDDTPIWVERDRDEPDRHTGDVVYGDPAIGVRAEVFRGGGCVIVCIDHA